MEPSAITSSELQQTVIPFDAHTEYLPLAEHSPVAQNAESDPSSFGLDFEYPIPPSLSASQSSTASQESILEESHSSTVQQQDSVEQQSNATTSPESTEDHSDTSVSSKSSSDPLPVSIEIIRNPEMSPVPQRKKHVASPDARAYKTKVYKAVCTSVPETPGPQSDPSLPPRQTHSSPPPMQPQVLHPPQSLGIFS